MRRQRRSVRAHCGLGWQRGTRRARRRLRRQGRHLRPGRRLRRQGRHRWPRFALRRQRRRLWPRCRLRRQGRYRWPGRRSGGRVDTGGRATGCGGRVDSCGRDSRCGGGGKADIATGSVACGGVDAGARASRCAGHGLGSPPDGRLGQLARCLTTPSPESGSESSASRSGDGSEETLGPIRCRGPHAAGSAARSRTSSRSGISMPCGDSPDGVSGGDLVDPAADRPAPAALPARSGGGSEAHPCRRASSIRTRAPSASSSRA
jgi:hypothetical protein